MFANLFQRNGYAASFNFRAEVIISISVHDPSHAAERRGANDPRVKPMPMRFTAHDCRPDLAQVPQGYAHQLRRKGLHDLDRYHFVMTNNAKLLCK